MEAVVVETQTNRIQEIMMYNVNVEENLLLFLRRQDRMRVCGNVNWVCLMV